MEAERPPQAFNVPAPILAGDFAGWLRDAMAARGMSQRMLAMLTGMDHSTISRLASGDRVPTLGTALALIRVLERPRLHVVGSKVEADS
jgi:transcriptional regulator with XRE-family HTH domain